MANIQTFTEYLEKVSEGKYDGIDLSTILDPLTIKMSFKSCGFSYNNFLESGNIKYIKDPGLSDLLKTYYITSCPEYNERATYHAMFISQNIEGPLLLRLNQKKIFLSIPKK
jgi:hypothetical protein